ncbi:MAG: hypothetical protein AXW14_04380 [Alteromonas sp. Nap_26]|nr:MAG: hypothetical protein AXW14_04380 [Alteromonas sp. Nap_26]
MQHILTKLTIATATIGLLAACGSNDPKGLPRVITSDYDGTWIASHYGKGLTLHNATLTVFDYTDDYCIATQVLHGVSGEDMAEVFYLDEDNQQIIDIDDIGDEDFADIGLVYEKVLESLPTTTPAACRDNMLSVVGSTGYEADTDRDLAYFYQVFSNYYVSFELTNTDWEEQYQIADSEINASSSNQDLFEVMANMIAPLKDSHVAITSEELGVASVNNADTFLETLLAEFAEDNGYTLPLNQQQLTAANQYIEQELAKVSQATLQYAESPSDLKEAGNGAIAWFSREGLGYLSIQRMFGFADDYENTGDDVEAVRQAMNIAMEELASTDGLVIDLRLNNGGRDAVSMALAQYFFTGEHHVFNKDLQTPSAAEFRTEVSFQGHNNAYTKPVILLTSASTVSAAEVFVLIMRNFDNVVIVGEPTQGAFSDALEKILPNGIAFSLSNEQYRSVDEEWFERSGIPVDVEVPVFTRSQRDNLEDHAIEAAVSILLGEE